MSDFKIPELPSDEELGIDEKDLEKFLEDDRPELSEKEMAALLGDAPKPPPPPTPKKPPKDPPKDPPKGPKKKAAPKPQEPSGPRSRWRGPAALGFLVVLAWLSSSYRYLPAPVPANAPDTSFASARAMANLVEIARRPHPPGSPAHAQVRGYLMERLAALGLEPQVQTATSIVGEGGRLRAATVRNIVARIPGRSSTGTLLLTAHYDGAEIARGAGDDGSGVVAILETLRAIGAGTPLRNDLIVLITDAEELGLLGARAFVDEHPWMADVDVVISLEMRGGGGPSIMFETGADNGWIVRSLASSTARPFANSFGHEVYKRLPNDTDFTPFKEAGKQGLNFAAIGRASVYHQTYDSPENFSEATLQQHGGNALAATRVLGNADLTEVRDADATYFSLPFFGIRTYGMELVLPFAAAVLALAALLLLVVRRAGGTWGGILTGFALSLLCAGVTAGAGYGLMAWLPRFHPEFGSLHGSAFHHEGWYVLALTGVSLAAVTTCFGVARRRFTAAALTWGALLPPLGAMAYVSVAFPAAAANLQWPLAATLLGVVLLVIPPRGRALSIVLVGTLALAVPVMVFLVPLTELLWLGLSFRAAAVIGTVLTLLLLLLLPALERLREPNAWWAPVSALLLGAAFLGLGIRASAPTASRPAPSTLALAFDHGTSESLWLTDTSEESVDSAAHSWAAGRAGSAFGETRSLDRFGYAHDRDGEDTRTEARVTPGPQVEAPRPEVWALSDTVVDGARLLQLAVRSPMGAELVQFLFPAGGGTRLTAINGQPVPEDSQATLVEHWGTPDPVILLDLEMAAETQPEMDVVEHLLRPQELLGVEPFQRPEELAPDIVWKSDRAMIRTPAASLDIMPGPPPFSLDSENALRTQFVEPGAASAPADAVPPVDTLPADTLPSATPAVTADTLVRPDTSVSPVVGARR
ncbi:MAG TPA: M20/M25/M40 family metallo-hydrolase [Longimicrobiales bacterium]|nr:M20/M25/M40 family metallo-hydrolase [Longimicrobiales bacterium]